jgi:hypothetical protein
MVTGGKGPAKRGRGVFMEMNAGTEAGPHSVTRTVYRESELPSSQCECIAFIDN